MHVIKDSEPADVGFVDFSDGSNDPIITSEDDDDDDDELIDEDTLLTEEDLKRPVVIHKFLHLITTGLLY